MRKLLLAGFALLLAVAPAVLLTGCGTNNGNGTTHQLTITVSGNGQVHGAAPSTPSEPGIRHFQKGHRFTLTAEPNAPRRFYGWYINGIRHSAMRVYTFYMPGYDITIQARFS